LGGEVGAEEECGEEVEVEVEIGDER